MEKNEINMQHTENNLSSLEDEGKKKGITKDKAGDFAKKVAKASIEEGVPVAMQIVRGMIQAACKIISLTLRIFFRG